MIASTVSSTSGRRIHQFTIDTLPSLTRSGAELRLCRFPLGSQRQCVQTPGGGICDQGSTRNGVRMTPLDLPNWLIVAGVVVVLFFSALLLDLQGDEESDANEED